MLITVLLATRNRAVSLAEVLTRYRELQAPAGGWQLVIVDNGSTDNTQEVLNEFRSYLPLTAVYEPRPGKTIALNAALKEVKGDLIVLTDDDVLPPRDWLTLYRDTADRNPDFTIFGGPSTPRWPSEPAAWMLPNTHIANCCFAIHLEELPAGPTTDIGRFGGNNMAVRSNVFLDLRFNPDVGPQGSAYAMGSDTDMLVKLTRKGARAWWMSKAEVQHIIRPDQMSARWILGRAIKSGRGAYRIEVTVQGHPKLLFGFPRYVVRKLLTRLVKLLASVVTLQRRKSFEHLWYVYQHYGTFVEAKQLRQRGPAETYSSSEPVRR